MNEKLILNFGESENSLSEIEMLNLNGGGKCASGKVQAALLVGCAVGGFFNPGVWVAGTAYFFYCNPQS